MELVYGRASPSPEFVSLSLSLRSDISGEVVSCYLLEPFLQLGPLSTISHKSCVDVLTELHVYINSVLKAASRTDTHVDRFLREDEKLLLDSSGNNASNVFKTQIFRPNKCHGIAMQYHVSRDRKQISQLVPLILNSSKLYPSNVSAGFEMSEVTTVVFCVGIGCGPSTPTSSCLTYSLSSRMRESICILCRLSTNGNRKKHSNSADTTQLSSSTTLDVASARTLLTTLLLTDDEERITNSAMNRERRFVMFQEDQFSKKTTNLKKKGQDNVLFETEDECENPLHVNSADQARTVVERMAVLSVYDTDTMFRRYEGRIKTSEKAGKKRLRKSTRYSDLDGFEFREEKRSSSVRKFVSNGNSVDDVSISARSTSTNKSNLTLKGPRKDTISRTANRFSRQKALPGLLASNVKDFSSTRNRKTTVDSSIAGARQRNMTRRMSNTNPSFSSPNQFNYTSSPSVMSGSGASLASTVRTTPGSIGSRSQARVQQHFDPFSDRTGSADTFITSPKMTFGTNEDNVPEKLRDGSIPKLLVNIVLNEDLTCFYKLSKLSSCSVEGVIQVQVRSNNGQVIPFVLQIRDSSKFIESIQENKKFAESISDKFHSTHSNTTPDYMFTISVSRSNDYFPVLRYKCGDKLRPVPIRVQTRVRLEEKHWRVALQISSNPHNENSLVDLTIIMGVPPFINGESLTTSPPGGVWNASKRSVIWCVSELSGGEKFQLQAKFEVDSNSSDHFEEEKPKFPVLVRCQCMSTQLSDIELEVSDIPQLTQADLRMKLARRFRLSHRERP